MVRPVTLDSDPWLMLGRAGTGAPAGHVPGDDLGDPRLDERVIAEMVAGMKDQAAGRTPEDLSAERDRMLTAIQAAVKTVR